MGYLLLPLLLGLSGQIDFWSGLILLLLYPGIMLSLYLAHDKTSKNGENHENTKPVTKELGLVLLGVTGVVLLSNLIVKTTQPILESLHVPGFLIGLILFSLGTNLPELIVAIRSWKRHIRELSLSNILGSAVTNPGMIGAFAMIRELPISLDGAYLILIISTLVIFMSVLHFYRTDRALKQNEGLILIFIYLLFAITSGIFTYFFYA
jgi:cation:H+ antiporter